MRTEPPSPLASALSRLRGPAGRARRWLAARGAATRIALLLVGLAAMGAMGYLASLDDPGERTLAWLYEGRKLSADDIDRITQALDAASIPHGEDSSGRVGVKPARKAEALLALAKSKAVPLSLDDLSFEADAGNSFLYGPEERERLDNLRLERILKAEIEGLDAAIASAHVQVHRLRKRGGYGAPSEISSIVYLRTEGGRKLGLRVVVGIETFLTGSVPGLKAEAITVVDQAGYKYLPAGNPLLKEQMQAHAREEDWGEKIAGELQHIRGLGVSVLLEAVPEPPPPPEVPPPAAQELALPNGKAVVEPDPPLVAPAPPAHPARIKANVWVRVPRSFYLLEFQSRSPNRQPTPDDLEPMRLTTERLIRDAVESHIPKDDLGVVKIGVFQDDLASSRPLLLPEVPEARRPWTWVALSGSVIAAGVLGVSLVRLATRRPSARPSRSPWRPGFVADGPSGPVPGPSERVREFIRLNPEAAAGVLQRWIGQGGALP